MSQAILTRRGGESSPKMVVYSNNEFAYGSVWEVCSAPKRDTLIAAQFSYNTICVTVCVYHADTQEIEYVANTSSRLEFSLREGKIFIKQTAENSPMRGKVVLME